MTPAQVVETSMSSQRVRVITRYVGSGIKGVGSGIRRVGSEITALGSGITDHGIGISSFFRDQGSGCAVFVGSGTKIGPAVGIKDQKFAYKNGISDEKTYLDSTMKEPFSGLHSPGRLSIFSLLFYLYFLLLGWRI